MVRKRLIPPQFKQNEDVGLEDLDAAFNSAEVIQYECVSWYAFCCPQNFIVLKGTYFLIFDFKFRRNMLWRRKDRNQNP
jgi:hypothetical protein